MAEKKRGTTHLGGGDPKYAAGCVQENKRAPAAKLYGGGGGPPPDGPRKEPVRVNGVPMPKVSNIK